MYKRVNSLNKLIIKKRQLQVVHGDLTATGTTQSIDIGAVWTVGIVVVGAYLDITTLFSGGSVSACTAQVGIKSGDTDSIIAATDVFTGAATGIVNTFGVGPAGYYGAITPSILFTSTTDNLINLSAGDLTVTIAYLDTAGASITG
jgi:hypothetical protein